MRDQNGNVRKFSRLFMGTDHLDQGGWVQANQPPPTQDQIFAVLDEAVRNGINVIDTSPIYVGGIEHIVGNWLQARKEAILSDTFYADKSLNPDRKIYVLSKGGFPFDLFYSKTLEPGQHSPELVATLQKQNILPEIQGPGPQALQNVPPGSYASRLYGSSDQIKQNVTEELGHTTDNLNGQLTVYLMHRDDFDSVDFNVISRAQNSVGNIMEALSSPEVSGKFAILGFSNWTADRVVEAVQSSQQNPALTRPRFNSPYFSLFEMGERSIHARGIQVKHADMMDPHFLEGVLIYPYSPLGGFSILDKPSPAWDNAKADAKIKHDTGDAYWQNVYLAIFTPQNDLRYQRAVDFLQMFNKTNGTQYSLDQLLNAYALAHKRMDFLTVGPITVDQVRRTVNSLFLSKRLTEGDLEYLYNVNPVAECQRLARGF